MGHMENSGTVEREWQICEAQEAGIISGCVGGWLPQYLQGLTAQRALLCFKAVGLLWLKEDTQVGKVLVLAKSKRKIYSQAFKYAAIHKSTYYSCFLQRKHDFSVAFLHGMKKKFYNLENSFFIPRLFLHRMREKMSCKIILSPIITAVSKNVWFVNKSSQGLNIQERTFHS